MRVIPWGVLSRMFYTCMLLPPAPPSLGDFYVRGGRRCQENRGKDSVQPSRWPCREKLAQVEHQGASHPFLRMREERFKERPSLGKLIFKTFLGGRGGMRQKRRGGGEGSGVYIGLASSGGVYSVCAWP